MGGGGAWSPTFTLQDEFTTAEANPLTSPRTCEPGPGALVISDEENLLNIVGGVLVPSGPTTGTTATPQVYENTAYARAAGRAVIMSRKGVSNTTWSYHGWAFSAPPIAAHTAAIYYHSGGSAGVKGDSVTTGQLISTSAFEPVGVILRTAGQFYIKSGVIEWVDNADVDTNLYPVFTRRASATDMAVDSVEWMRVLDLPAPFNTQNGLATAVTATPLANATTTAEVNALIEFTWTAVTNETLNFMVRRTDDDNCWIIRGIQADGLIKLIQKEGGSETERDSDARTWTNGTAYRIVVRLMGDAIQVWVNNAPLSVYTSATFNNTATGVKVDKAGANLITWPRTLTGTAKTVWDLACAANP